MFRRNDNSIGIDGFLKRSDVSLSKFVLNAGQGMYRRTLVFCPVKKRKEKKKEQLFLQYTVSQWRLRVDSIVRREILKQLKAFNFNTLLAHPVRLGNYPALFAVNLSKSCLLVQSILICRTCVVKTIRIVTKSVQFNLILLYQLYIYLGLKSTESAGCKI